MGSLTAKSDFSICVQICYHFYGGRWEAKVMHDAQQLVVQCMVNGFLRVELGIVLPCQSIACIERDWIRANPQEYDCSAWKNAWIRR